MPSDPTAASSSPPDIPDEGDLLYSIEVIAELAGVDTTTVLHYHEQGFLQPVRSEASTSLQFDAGSLRQLRRMEHLRATCGVNEAGLRLILQLLREVERLQGERRRMSR